MLVIVPDDEVDIELNEAHASFYQLPGHEATAPVGVSRFLAYSICVSRRRRLLVDIERIASLF